MGVQILRLPVVALKVLLDYLNKVELVTLSLLSRRADWFLKACGKVKVSFFNLEGSEIRYLQKIRILELFILEKRRQGELPDWNFQLCCSVSYDQHISISCRNFTVPIHFEALENIENFEGIRRNLKIGDSFFPVVIIRENDGVEKLRTFWDTKTHGMIVLLDYFRNDFNLSIELLTLAGNGTRAIRTVINHINSTQTVVKNVQVERYPPISEKNFKFVLNNLSATGSFSSHLELSRNFKFEGTIRAKNIHIHNGRWFTSENLLMNTENEVIYVNGSEYHKIKVRRFLTEWQSGKFPKLKLVNLATNFDCSDAERVLGYLEKRRDKCVDTGSRQVVAIKGHGDSYGIVYPAENGHQYFRMRVFTEAIRG